MSRTRSRAAEFESNLNRLRESDRALLELLAFCHEEIEDADLTGLFRAYAATCDLQSIRVSAALRRLETAGFLHRDNDHSRADPLAVEEISAYAAAAGRAEKMIQVIKRALEEQPDFHLYNQFSLARLELYRGKTSAFERSSHVRLHGQGYRVRKPLSHRELNLEPCLTLLAGMRTGAAFEVLPKRFGLSLARELMLTDLEYAVPPGVYAAWLEQKIEEHPQGDLPLLMVENWLAREQTDHAQRLLNRIRRPELQWCFSVAQGHPLSDAHEPEASSPFWDHPLLFFLFAVGCLRSGRGLLLTPPQLNSKAGPFEPIYRCLLELGQKPTEDTFRAVLKALENPLKSYLSFFWPQQGLPEPTLLLFCGACVLYWGGYHDECAQLEPELELASEKYEAAGFDFIARQLQNLSATLKGDEKPSPFLAQIAPRERWQVLLTGLEGLIPERDSKPPLPARRICWVIDFDGEQRLEIRLQTWGKRGTWTPGRQMETAELDSLYPEGMDEHDQRVFESWVGTSFHRRRTMGRLLLALLEHPRVFNPSGQRLRLSRGVFEVAVLESGDQIQIRHPLTKIYEIAFRKLSATEYELLPVEGHLKQLMELTDRFQGVEIPSHAHSTVANLLARHVGGELRLVSDRRLDEEGELQPADPTLVVRLFPEGDGLRIVTLVAPSGGPAPTYPPGQGGAFVRLGQGREAVTYQRDLAKETGFWRKLSKQVPHLSEFEVVLIEPQSCLEMVEALTLAPLTQVRVEWPEGVKFRLKARFDWGDFALSVRRKRDWLAVGGELQLSDTERWSLQQVIERLKQQGSRFISLGRGEFLALSREFQRRLDGLSRAAIKSSDSSLELDTLAASVLLANGKVISSDAFWRSIQSRLEEARAFEPAVPTSLRARLRPYQEQGFRWLTTCAHRRVGCCLADDMGLGKTLQALALVLSRVSPEGRPTLVVAPTSVCFNWAEEIRRFTPTLTPHLFHQLDRDSALEGLGGLDVVIVSYGLLVNESKRFRALTWSHLIADEAQAVKNPQTQRFKAVTALRAEFRLATTGTPVENSVDEIWALFQFLNPGLLGSRKRFLAAYGGLEQSEEKRESLRRLVTPFLLRRLKSEVLKHLPPRTDVNLLIDLPPAERLFYEGVRQHALKRLEKAEKASTVSILTELTRLRQACCHPRLLDSETVLEGAKLRHLIRLLRDLQASGHRALVFSQFVRYLKVVQAELDRHHLTYLYLDGSTPAQNRGELVRRFQEGDSAFFLISLKAGGTGLNLTSANYVVHLDPWWNPAVEDQASDRAHRLGQTQPVTVYRLIAKGTVEEKILQLHTEKRDLADSLLSGTDQAASLTPEELLALIRQSVLSE